MRVPYGSRLVGFAAALALSVLAGCSVIPSPSAPTPSTTAVADGDLAPDAPQTLEAAKASSDAVMLTAAELPGGEWQPGGPVAEDDFRQYVCGVDTEPNPPVTAFIGRRVRADGKGMLFETVRPIGATRAREIVAALTETLRTCKQDRRAKGEAVYTYDIAPVAVGVPEAVAYRQVQTSGAIAKAEVGLVYFVAKDSLVVFTVFGDEPPSPGFLDSLVRAVREKA